MKIKKTKFGIKHYYDAGDEIVDLKTGLIHMVKYVDVKTREIVTTDHERLQLADNIKPARKNTSLNPRQPRQNTKSVKIKYHNKNLTRIEKLKVGDWIDLRCLDATRVVMDNSIQDVNSHTDLPVLNRKTYKFPVTWETGIFINEDNVREKVKFFRYEKGDFLLINLGISMELPFGFEANIVARSSTFKTLTTMQTNAYAIIDESYKGDNDIWFLPLLAMEDGFMIFDERVCQFRINKKMPNLDLNEVEFLNNENRGGHGSTGTK